MSHFRRIFEWALFAVIALSFAARGQELKPKEVLLWPEGAPGAVGSEDADKPSLTLYTLPTAKTPRSAVIVCPGGGYQFLALDHEGRQIALWLNGYGLDAFVLKYRIAPRYHHPAPMLDVQRALRYVRSQAAEFGIAPDRIGVWGFSAGGHLASTAATHFDAGNAALVDPIDRVNSRPDFAILAYPVITCSEPFRHAGSCRNLIGEHPDAKLAAYMSNEKQVTAQTPPTFLFHTANDDGVPVENSLVFFEALRKAGVPAEMHIYERGPHGVGLAPFDPVLSTWSRRLADWLRAHGLITNP